MGCAALIGQPQSYADIEIRSFFVCHDGGSRGMRRFRESTCVCVTDMMCGPPLVTEVIVNNQMFSTSLLTPHSLMPRIDGKALPPLFPAPAAPAAPGTGDDGGDDDDDDDDSDGGGSGGEDKDKDKDKDGSKPGEDDASNNKSHTEEKNGRKTGQKAGANQDPAQPAGKATGKQKSRSSGKGQGKSDAAESLVDQGSVLNPTVQMLRDALCLCTQITFKEGDTRIPIALDHSDRRARIPYWWDINQAIYEKDEWGLALYAQLLSALEDPSRACKDWVKQIREVIKPNAGWGTHKFDVASGYGAVVTVREESAEEIAAREKAMASTPKASSKSASKSAKTKSKSSRKVGDSSQSEGDRRQASSSPPPSSVEFTACTEWVWGNVQSVIADCVGHIIDGETRPIHSADIARYCELARHAAESGRTAIAFARLDLSKSVAESVYDLDRDTAEGEASYQELAHDVEVRFHQEVSETLDGSHEDGASAATKKPAAGPLSSITDQVEGKTLLEPIRRPGWVCESCTLVNSGDDTKCVACRATRPAPSSGQHSQPSWQAETTPVSPLLQAGARWNMPDWSFEPASQKQGEHALRRPLVLVGIVFIVEPPAADIRSAMSACREQGIRLIAMRDQSAHGLAALCKSSQIFTKPLVTVLEDIPSYYDEWGYYVDGSLLADLPLKSMSDVIPSGSAVVVDLAAPSLDHGVDVEAIILKILRSAAEEVCFARCSPAHRACIVDALKSSDEKVLMVGTTEADLDAMNAASVSMTEPVTAFLTMPGAVEPPDGKAFLEKKLTKAFRKTVDKTRKLGGKSGGEEEAVEEDRLRFVVRDGYLAQLLRSLATFYEAKGPALLRRTQLRERQAKYRQGAGAAASPVHGVLKPPTPSGTRGKRGGRGLKGGKGLSVKTSKKEGGSDAGDEQQQSPSTAFTLDFDELRRYFPFADPVVIPHLMYDENISVAQIDQVSAATIATATSKILNRYTELEEDEVIVTDATAGYGGVPEAMARRFKKIHAVEPDEKRMEILQNNMELLGVADGMSFWDEEFLAIMGRWHQDVIFLDGSGKPSLRSSGASVKDSADLGLSSANSRGGGSMRRGSESEISRRRRSSMERRSSLDGGISPHSPGLGGRPWSGAGGRRSSPHKRGGGRAGTPSNRGGGGSGAAKNGAKNGRVFERPLITVVKLVAAACKTTPIIMLRVPVKYDHQLLSDQLLSALPRCVVAPPMSVRDMCLVGVLPFGIPKKRSRAVA